MAIWVLPVFSFLVSLKFLYVFLDQTSPKWGIKSHQLQVRQVGLSLAEIEETLLSGLVPHFSSWEKLKELPEPWGELSYHSLKELRACGGALMPTLARIRSLASEQEVSLSNARAKSAQAVAQAGLCSLLVPVIGAGLYAMVPGICEKVETWLVACGIALGMAGLGAWWLLYLTEVARWGGLKSSRRTWILGSLCAGEKFLALIRTGIPPDLAWTRACEILQKSAGDLVVAWGNSVWDSDFHLKQKPGNQSGGLDGCIIGTGGAIKKAVQVSLMEGRPCVDKVEAVLLALRRDIESQIERELTLLATRALKPLFICVAPALLGLLGFGLFLAVQASGTILF